MPKGKTQNQKANGNGGKAKGDLSIFGQESNPTTRRLAKNVPVRKHLAIRGIEADLGEENADSFHRDLHKDLKADYILANPPFNMSDWGGDRLRDDVRWKYRAPPVGNANFAWVQHFIHHLAPTGTAGFVLANGSMSSNTGGEGEIRQAIIEADLVDCMVALPGQLFYSTQIPVCLWFLSRNKRGGASVPASRKFTERRGKVLFLDARKMGRMLDRVHRELTEEDIQKIAGTYHAWRGDGGASVLASRGKEGKGSSVASPHQTYSDIPAFGKHARWRGPVDPIFHQTYSDIPGFGKSAKLDEIRAHGHVLTPGRYVGAEEAEDDLPAPRPGVFFVYAIACEGGSLYIGHTDDLRRRWREHITGQGADWTNAHKPQRIAHYEELTTREAAVAREKELKTTAGRRWLKAAVADGRARQAGGEPFEEKMKLLPAKLEEQFAESARLGKAIRRNLKPLDF